MAGRPVTRRRVLAAIGAIGERDTLVDHLRAVGVLGAADRGYDVPPGAGDVTPTVGAADPLTTLLSMGTTPGKIGLEHDRRFSEVGDWPRYGPSFARRLAPAGRWWFAGDWLSRAVGWQHGAIESASRAVTGVHEQVREGRR